MDMVGYSANFEGNAVHSFDDTADVLEYAWEVLLAHGDSCTFNVEDEVDVDFRK